MTISGVCSKVIMIPIVRDAGKVDLSVWIIASHKKAEPVHLCLSQCSRLNIIKAIQTQTENLFYLSRSNCHQAVDSSWSRFGMIRTQYLIFDDYILYQIFLNCRLVILPSQNRFKSLSGYCQQNVWLSRLCLTVRRQTYYLCKDRKCGVKCWSGFCLFLPSV